MWKNAKRFIEVSILTPKRAHPNGPDVRGTDGPDIRGAVVQGIKGTEGLMIWVTRVLGIGGSNGPDVRGTDGPDIRGLLSYGLKALKAW